MNNQSSPAQLLFPTVPANYCPEGKWSDILNSFIQLYLNNGTVNIPGLGQVTPQQIATINQNILDLQNEYTALQAQVNAIPATTVYSRTGTITSPTLAVGVVVYPITFSSALPSANYVINVQFDSSSTTSATPQNYTIISGTKTTTGFSLKADITAPNAITQITWTATYITPVS
jgi:hypothetical protein